HLVEVKEIGLELLQHTIDVNLDLTDLNVVLTIPAKSLLVDNVILYRIAVRHKDPRIAWPLNANNVVYILVQKEENALTIRMLLDDFRISLRDAGLSVAVVSIDQPLVWNVFLDLRPIECLIGITFNKGIDTLAVRVVVCQEFMRHRDARGSCLSEQVGEGHLSLPV